MREERETCGVPSGIRLMNLLRERLTEIMDRERANRNSIHLYCTGPYWVAFERSAYQLHRAFPDSETTPLRLFAYPFPIVMVSVTDRSLRSYARKHILRWDETDYVVLTAPESSSTDYRRWHGQKAALGPTERPAGRQTAGVFDFCVFPAGDLLHPSFLQLPKHTKRTPAYLIRAGVFFKVY